MKLTADVQLNLNAIEVLKQTVEAAHAGVRDTLVDITADVVRDSPYLTGHNRRSVAMKMGKGHKVTQGTAQPGEEPFTDLDPILAKSEGAVFSTSGYGGFLETDGKHPPYFRPALDRHIGKLAANIKKRMGL